MPTELKPNPPTALSTTTPGQLIKFIRRRDYKLVRDLGQGACGRTVLLHDEYIDKFYVCKKYEPYSEAKRQELFEAFVREVKLLHEIHHVNLVRVFNHYLYPEKCTGYILMEYVQGTTIDEYIATHPETVNEVFLQAISGFAYLEHSGILHRDIRPGNVMVRDDGVLKVIDLGFGKRVQTSTDFDKSISLNWWCEPPDEFNQGRYDFATEVYFVGKLFQRLLRENGIEHFKYSEIVGQMCEPAPGRRLLRFDDIQQRIGKEQFSEISFTAVELCAYRNFAAAIGGLISKIERGTKYVDDLAKIKAQLNEAWRACMLAEEVPDAATVLRCFIDGQYYYRKRGLKVTTVKEFLQLIKTCDDERGRIILRNLHESLNALPRYFETPLPPEEEIPF
jgi:eukaryotic-like serine/threonine-protein kinase